MSNFERILTDFCAILCDVEWVKVCSQQCKSGVNPRWANSGLNQVLTGLTAPLDVVLIRGGLTVG